MKTNILPRQARDKHRKAFKKDRVPPGLAVNWWWRQRDKGELSPEDAAVRASELGEEEAVWHRVAGELAKIQERFQRGRQ
jgi:hypothetical protein